MKRTIVALIAVVLLAGCLASKVPVVTIGPNGLPVTNSVYAPTPLAGQITSGAQAVAPFIPPPYGTLMTVLAGLLGTGIASFVAFKNKQLADTATGVNATIIQGVESLGDAAKAVKQAVAATAVENGNADAVHKAVQANV